MKSNPIVDEIHQIRQELLEEHGGDMGALVKKLQRLTEASKASGAGSWRRSRDAAPSLDGKGGSSSTLAQNRVAIIRSVESGVSSTPPAAHPTPKSSADRNRCVARMFRRDRICRGR